MTQNLQTIECFRTIWALNDLRKGVLKCTHYALVLIAGRNPTWGVIELSSGKVTHEFGSRSAIEKSRDFKNKSWRRAQIAWKNTSRVLTEPMSLEDHVDYVRQQIAAANK